MANPSPWSPGRMLPASALTTLDEMDRWHAEDRPDCSRMSIKPAGGEGLCCKRCGWMLWVLSE